MRVLAYAGSLHSSLPPPPPHQGESLADRLQKGPLPLDQVVADLVGPAGDRSARPAPFVYVSGSFGQWQISIGGGSRARWRGDGRELHFGSPDGFLMAVAIETQPVFRPSTRKLFQLPEQPDRILPIFEDVTPDGKRFLPNVPVTARSSVGFHVIVNWRSLADSRAD